MLAGHDTVTSALGWICYTLSRHKNWFQLCQQEADSLFAANNFNEIRFDQLKKMNKIEMFIKETLRLVLKNYLRSNNHLIKKYFIMLIKFFYVKLILFLSIIFF